ncbi:MAG: hypothetical protein ABSG53_22305, partial [Thermoguttaceae bacterium]
MLSFQQLLFAVRRGWIAAGAGLSRQYVEGRVVSRVVRRVEDYRRLSDRDLDRHLAELRTSAVRKAARDVTTQSREGNQEEGTWALVSAPRSGRLLTSDADYDLFCEGIALGAVLMGGAMGIWLHPNQLTAATALCQGYVVQLDTGEGKTFVGAMKAFIDNLFGLRTTIVVPNGYLASRDAAWMRPFYTTAGLSVDCADGEDGRRENPTAYQQDVCYVSIDRLMFDHVGRVTCRRLSDWIPYDLQSVVIDEVDAVMLDGPNRAHAIELSGHLDVYQEAHVLASQLRKGQYIQDEAAIYLSDEGYRFLEARRPEFPVLSVLDRALFQFHIRSTLLALHRYRRDQDYIVADGRVIVIDRSTGRRMPGSSLGLGIQQAVEFKEGVLLSWPKCIVYAINPEAVLKKAPYLCGMSGSASHERIAFRFLFGLPVMVIPPNRPTGRRVWTDEIWPDRSRQLKRVVELSERYYRQGQPVLIGTQSIEDAEDLSARFVGAGCPAQLITAKNDHQEAAIFREAVHAGRITIAARMAGRGVDIKVEQSALDAGGLAVISVGRFILRRLDDQLVGRTGRQGEPGQVHFVLSLDDALFSNMPLRNWLQSNSEDECIESPVIADAVRRKQSFFRDVAYLGLRSRLLMERVLSPVREEYERQRFYLLSQAVLKDYVDKLIAEVVRQACGDCDHWLWNRLPRALRPHFGKSGVRNVEVIVESVLDEYENRRLTAGQHAELRERHIFLRCFDFQWAMLFLDWERHVEMRPEESVSLFHDIGFINQRADIFRQEFSEHSVYYLLSIDEDDVLVRCYYWRGTILPASQDVALEDGWGALRPPDDKVYSAMGDGGGPNLVEGDETMGQRNGSGNMPLPNRHPPRQQPPKALVAPRPDLERLRVRQYLWIPLQDVLLTLALAVVAGGILWAAALWAGAGAFGPPANNAATASLWTRLGSQLSSLVLMHAGKDAGPLIICLSLMLLIQSVVGRRIRGPATLLTLPAVLIVGLLAPHWMGRSLGSCLGAFALYGAATVLAAQLWSAAGIGSLEGLGLVTGLLWLRSAGSGGADADTWVTSVGTLAAFLITTAVVGVFRVRSYRGWDHTTQGENVVEQWYVVGAVDDVIPPIVAWSWGTVVWHVASQCLVRAGVAIPEGWTAVAIVGSWVLVMAWVAHQRAAARILPEHLTALEWCWNGTLFRGERPV